MGDPKRSKCGFGVDDDFGVFIEGRYQPDGDVVRLKSTGTRWKGEAKASTIQKRYRGNWSDSGAGPGVGEVGRRGPGLFLALGYMPARKQRARPTISGDYSGNVACGIWRTSLCVVKTLGRMGFIQWRQTSNAAQEVVNGSEASHAKTEKGLVGRSSENDGLWTVASSKRSGWWSERWRSCPARIDVR